MSTKNTAMLVWALVLAVTLVPARPAAGDTPPDQGRVIGSADEFAVLPHRERAPAENRILEARMESLLPRLMEEVGLDMWLVINREYAEDPVYFSLVPQPSFAARRTTMLVFNRKDDGSLERLSVNRYPLGVPYETAWEGGELDAQWAALAELVESRNPARIGINVSRQWAVADGLTQGMYQRLVDVLPETYAARLTSAEDLVVRWLETRSAGELAVYPQVVGLARGVIAEAFSSRVITPGVTTTDDVAWYMRQRLEELGLSPWFMPYVNRQAADLACEREQDYCGEEGLIRPGDVLHTDIGICYLKLCSDTQEMAYVLRPGEDDVPAGLRAALATGNRWQDVLTGQFEAGRTGNEVLAGTRAAADRAGLVSTTYSHPIGYFGHAPGPTIGMWDNQGPTVGQGDWPLYADTAYAIEGNIKAQVPEWNGRWVQIKLEQSAVFDGEDVTYLAGRQTRWHVVR